MQRRRFVLSATAALATPSLVRAQEVQKSVKAGFRLVTLARDLEHVHLAENGDVVEARGRAGIRRKHDALLDEGGDAVRHGKIREMLGTGALYREKRDR